MGKSFTYPSVTTDLLTTLVTRIRTVGDPLKIILFGSRARGDARPDSDLDILIIEDSDLPRHRRSAAYRRALIGLFPSKDIVVWTPDEIAQWATVPNAFITTALSEGKVLYERTSRRRAGQDSPTHPVTKMSKSFTYPGITIDLLPKCKQR